MGGEGEGEEAGSVVLWLPLKDDPTFDLEKAVCSHGLFMMAPNLWNPTTKTLQRPLRLLSSTSTSSSSSSLTVRVSHPDPPSSPLLLSVFGTTSLSSQDQQALLDQVSRMLRISDDNDRMIGEFHKIHEVARERGFGRVFRSPTLFEDMVKCILLCNCKTLSMARALCELQLELKCCSTAEGFQPKTPQPRELKRKHEKGNKVVMKLETKFEENEGELVEDVNSLVSHDSQPKHPQGKELSSNGLLCLGDPHDGPNTSQISNASVMDASGSVHPLLEGTSCPSYQVGDFPSPEELAILDEDLLANRCKLGYRAKRILSLAQDIVEHKLHLRKLEEVCDGFRPSSYAQLDEQLSGIYGFGPFTRANVLMCMGFYHRIPADSETIRHLKQFHARRSCTIQSVQKDLEAIYGEYAPFQFLAYWSELWDYYEKKFGRLSEMPPSDYQLITASNMKSKIRKRGR